MKYSNCESEFLFLTNHKSFDSRFDYFKNTPSWDYNRLNKPYWKQELYYPHRAWYHCFYFCWMEYKGEEV